MTQSIQRESLDKDSPEGSEKLDALVFLASLLKKRKGHIARLICGALDVSTESFGWVTYSCGPRLMPILALMYLLAFMDRGNIGNAKLEGLLTQLHMTSSDCTTALVIFFVAYCVFEPPSNLLLKKFRPSR